VDISIKGLPSGVDIDELARQAGLRRPYASDKVHFEMLDSQLSYQMDIVGNSPINILVTDPKGRRVGFDPVTGQEVNDFGAFAWYTGGGSEPQVIHFELGEVLTGDYLVTGIGTGDGPYSVTMRAWGENPNPAEYDVEKTLFSGVARSGEMLPEITGSIVVPEPSVALLATCLALGFGRSRRR
jgi:hypothetical protein